MTSRPVPNIAAAKRPTTALPGRRRLLQAAAGSAALLVLAACGRKKPAALALPAGTVVLALGDSLTSGVGAGADTAYPAVLAAKTGWQVVNGGVSGDTSAQALARLPALLQQHQPRLVIVSIGGNDFLRRLSATDTRSHIEKIVQTAQAAGAQVLLVGVPELTAMAALGKPSDHALYAELADALKVPLHSDGWSNVLSQPSLRADTVHANAAGYAQFVDGLVGTLQSQGFLAR